MTQGSTPALSSICPNCRFENAPLLRYCGQCGARLVEECPSCRAPISENLKYCGQCGLNLAQVRSASHLGSDAAGGTTESSAALRVRQRRIMWWLVGLTVVGLLLRVALVSYFNSYLPNSTERLGGDETGYNGLALEMLYRGHVTWPGRPLLYPVFLAGIYSVFGPSVVAVTIIQALLGAALVPATYLLARRFMGQTASLVAAALVALNPVLVEQARQVLPDSVFTLTLIAVVLQVVRARASRHWFDALTLGVAVGIAVLFKPESVLLPVVLWPLFRRRQDVLRSLGLCAALVAGALLVVLPHGFSMYVQFGELVPLGTAGVILTWLGSPEFYALWAIQGYSQTEIWQRVIDPVNKIDPWTIDGSRLYWNRALASIAAEPRTYLQYALYKLAFLWTGHPANDWDWIFAPQQLGRYYQPWRLAGVYLSRSLPLFALAAAVIGFRKLGKYAPILSVSGYFTGVYALTYAEARYGEPLHPLLVVLLVGVAVSATASGRKAPARPIPATSHDSVVQ